MKKILLLMALTLIVSGAYGVEKFTIVKCTSDSYVSKLSPDTNYGSSTELVSQTKFSYNGTTFTNTDNEISYYMYGIPVEYVGKVKIIECYAFMYVNLYKGSTPYKAGKGVFSAGFYPCLTTWGEMTITYNNQPASSGPGYFELDSSQNTYTPQVGLNKFPFSKNGVAMIQKVMDTGTTYGMSLYVDVTGPSGSTTLLAGDYVNQLRIASRETGKKMPYLYVGYEVKTGNVINGSNINPATLGELKAQYH